LTFKRGLHNLSLEKLNEKTGDWSY